MTKFLLSLGAFLLAHAVSLLPAVRGRLVALLGRPTYLVLYSALSLVQGRVDEITRVER